MSKNAQFRGNAPRGTRYADPWAVSVIWDTRPGDLGGLLGWKPRRARLCGRSLPAINRWAGRRDGLRAGVTWHRAASFSYRNFARCRSVRFSRVDGLSLHVL